ncbi:MAG: LCP family protein [Chloroflexota bacterium]|nr:LCP family protein [Chloroflexota bacterium]
MEETQPHRRPMQPQARHLRRTDPEPRGRANWRRRFAVIGLALPALLLVGVVFLWQRAVAFNDAVSTESALSMRLFGPFSPDRVNVLLLGYSDESREGAYLSDSMNVISIDKATDTTSMIAIPRDLWVEGIEEVPQNMKINEALRHGYYEDGIEYGAELASKAVTHVTGLEIHGWMTLDFQGFEAMVNAVGGITLENPRAFSYTWTEPNWLAGSFADSFEAGTLELDGRLALDYARNRYASIPEESSDFARLARQQRVLQAIRAKVSGWPTLSNGLAVADALEGHLHTNLPVIDLGMLVGKLDVDRRVELREDQILQASTNTNGQYVLLVVGQSTSSDYEPLHSYLTAELAAPIASEQSPAPTP